MALIITTHSRVCVFCVCSVLAHRIANDFPTLSGDTSVGGAAYGPLRTTAWEAPAARSASFDADSFPTLGGGTGNTKSGKRKNKKKNNNAPNSGGSRWAQAARGTPILYERRGGRTPTFAELQRRRR